MDTVPAAWLLVTLLVALASGNPTDVYGRHEGELLDQPLEGEVLDQPLQEDGRKIGGGLSKHSIQVISREAFVKNPELFSTKKGEKPPRVVVLQNGDPGGRANKTGPHEKIYIDNKPVHVEYVNRNSLPKDHPLRKAAEEKRKESELNFSQIFQSLFEIVQDVLTIMSHDDTHINAVEKSDNGVIISSEQPDRWYKLRKIFLKYLNLLKTSDVFAEFRQVIPVTQLEHALEKGDQVELVGIFVKSITPGFFSYFCGLLKDLMYPLLHLKNNIGSAELREFIPSDIDLLWPIRFFAHRTLGWIGNYFSRRELNNYWEQFRSLSPFAAPSLDYIIPEEDEEMAMNSLMAHDISRQDGKSLLETAMGHPYLLLAGVGGTVMASVYAYKSMRPEFTDGSNRIKRSALDETESYPWNSIISAAESNPYVDTFDDSSEIPSVKPKKTSSKKYSSSQMIKKA